MHHRFSKRGAALQTATRTATTIVCIAHNASGFDGIFIAKALLDRPQTPLKFIMNGHKILLIIAMFKVKFVDSLNHIPLPLKDLPATFNLVDCEKTYFPYLFNREENFASIVCNLHERDD